MFLWIVGSLLLFSGSAHAAEIQVLSPGAGTLRELRYHPPVGTRQDARYGLTITAQTTVQAQVVNVAIPEVTAVLTGTVAAASGGVQVSWHYATPSVGAGDELGRMAAEAVKAGLTGVHGAFTLSPTGALLSSDAQLPPASTGGGVAVDPSTFDPSHWVVEFPVAPMGVGGTWMDTRSVTKAGSPDSRVRATYTITSMTADTVTVSASVVQHSAGEASTAGVSIDVTSLDAQTSAQFVIRLDRPFPVGGSELTTLNSTMVLFGMNTKQTTTLRSTFADVKGATP